MHIPSTSFVAASLLSLVTAQAPVNQAYNYSLTPFDSQTAFFFLDYIPDVLNSIRNKTVLDSFMNASTCLLNAVRATHQDNNTYVPLTGFSTINFLPGYPELSPKNKGFQPYAAFGAIQANASQSDSAESLYYPGFAPAQNEVGFKKLRFDASFNSQMLTLLAAHNIQKVVMAGAITSGVILSTMRSLADRDYILYIVKDPIVDNGDVSYLTDTYFPTQSYVLSLSEALDRINAGYMNGTGSLGNVTAPGFNVNGNVSASA